MTAVDPCAASTGGAVRSFHLLRSIAECSELSLAIFCTPESDVDRNQSVSHLCHCTITAEASSAQTTRQSLLRRLASIFVEVRSDNGRQLILTGWSLASRIEGREVTWLHAVLLFVLTCWLKIARRWSTMHPIDVHIRRDLIDDVLARLESEFPADKPPQLIWVEHSYLYSVAEQVKSCFPSAPIVVNAHNVETRLKESVAASCQSLVARRWEFAHADLVREIELRMLRDAAAAYCCSDSDISIYRRIAAESGQSLNCQLFNIPNGVDTRWFIAADRTGDEKCLLFTGTAGYRPNDEAVKLLTQQIWPDLRDLAAGIRLIIAGRNAKQYWSAYVQNDDSIELHSDVPDMRVLMQRACVSLVPLQSGSGTRLKIVEAMSMRIPVVSTTIGAEGLNLKNNEEILIADSAADFRDAVSKLITDPDFARRISENAHRRAVADYDWLMLERRLRESFLALLAQILQK